MEVAFYEDPACSWCWAFEPVATALDFELGRELRIRHVMGGLRDRPPADDDFIRGQWKKAQSMSGMPFETLVWEQRPLQTTYLACRAVKAAAIADARLTTRFLRRLREAFFTEKVLIDDVTAILSLAAEVGLDVDALKENLANGRAEELFSRDRHEASQQGFGFPTIILMSTKQESPVVLQGAVDYEVILDALHRLGVSPRKRRRFQDVPEHWHTLFELRTRLTMAELRRVTGWTESELCDRLESLGAARCGPFFTLHGESTTAFSPAGHSAGASCNGSAACASANGNHPPTRRRVDCRRENPSEAPPAAAAAEPAPAASQTVGESLSAAPPQAGGVP